jgi:hypothetical protein
MKLSVIGGTLQEKDSKDCNDIRNLGRAGELLADIILGVLVVLVVIWVLVRGFAIRF